MTSQYDQEFIEYGIRELNKWNHVQVRLKKTAKIIQGAVSFKTKTVDIGLIYIRGGIWKLDKQGYRIEKVYEEGERYE